jgi:hypothetical protein
MTKDVGGLAVQGVLVSRLEAQLRKASSMAELNTHWAEVRLYESDLGEAECKRLLEIGHQRERELPPPVTARTEAPASNGHAVTQPTEQDAIIDVALDKVEKGERRVRNAFKRLLWFNAGIMGDLTLKTRAHRCAAAYEPFINYGGGLCHVSRERAAKIVNMTLSMKTLERGFLDLEAAGYISVYRPRRQANGTRAANIVTPCIPPAAEARVRAAIQHLPYKKEHRDEYVQIAQEVVSELVKAWPGNPTPRKRPAKAWTVSDDEIEIVQMALADVRPDVSAVVSWTRSFCNGMYELDPFTVRRALEDPRILDTIGEVE